MRTRRKRNAHGRVNRNKPNFSGEPSLRGGWLNGDTGRVRKRRNVSKKTDRGWKKRRRVPSQQTDRVHMVLPSGKAIDTWSYAVEDLPEGRLYREKDKAYYQLWDRAVVKAKSEGSWTPKSEVTEEQKQITLLKASIREARSYQQ